MHKLGWQKWVVVLLVVLCMTTLFACGQDEVLIHGLDIVEDEAQVADLTPQETDRLSTALYGVMERVVAAGVSTFTQTIEEQLQKVLHYLAQEVAQLFPTADEYAALMAVLQRYSEAETLSAKMLADNLYVDLTSALGGDKCGTLLHRILLKYCDYQAQEYQKRYDKYGFASLSEEVQRYRNKYQVLSTRLTPADLTAVLNTVYLLASARSMASEADTNGFLSADEILLLLKAQNCTAVALDADVWYELLTLAQDFVFDGYYGKIVEAAVGNGDVRLLAEGMNDLVALIRHVQLTIRTEDVQAIRQGEPVANVILALIEDDQLRQIDAFLSQGWHYAKYNSLAAKQYGDRYQQFTQQIDTKTLDQLLEARRDAPDAAALFVGYLAGKCYALAWEVQP